MTATPAQRAAQWAIRTWCRWAIRHRMSLDAQGFDVFPSNGPVLLVSRHVHHTYDGVIFLGLVRRTVHIVVALDWVALRPLRHLMETACRLAGWPAVLRSERLRARGDAPPQPSVYGAEDVAPFLRRAVRQCIAILRRGDVLVVFPEAYPVIDPVPGPRRSLDKLLPFRRGFVELVRLAERDGRTRVAVVPVGLRYEEGDRRRVTARFGSALYFEDFQDPAHFAERVEVRVRELSGSAATEQSE